MKYLKLYFDLYFVNILLCVRYLSLNAFYSAILYYFNIFYYLGFFRQQFSNSSYAVAVTLLR